LCNITNSEDLLNIKAGFYRKKNIKDNKEVESMISVQFTAIVRITCNRNNCSLVRSIFKFHIIELHFWNRNPDYM